MKTMAHQALDGNPFITYREPTTGRWVIVYPNQKDSQPDVRSQIKSDATHQ